MKAKGISAIVSIVLLISISVIAAVGIYFWASGLVTKQPTSKSPIPITAVPLDNKGHVAVANLGSKPLTLDKLNSTAGIKCDFGGTVTIQPGGQAVCTIPPKSGKIVLWGSGTGSTEIELPKAAEVTVTSSPGFETKSWVDTSFPGTYSNTTTGSLKLLSKMWWESNITGNDDREYESDAGVDSNGIVHVAFTADGPGGKDIYYANSSSGWNVTQVSGSHGDPGDNSPSLVIDSNGIVHVAWHRKVDEDHYIYYANSSSSWENVRITSGTPGSADPYVTVDNDGVVHIVWIDRSDNGDAVYYANSSSGWNQTKLVDRDSHPRYPSLFIDNNGIKHIIFMDDYGDRENIYYANSSSGWDITSITNTDDYDEVPEAVFSSGVLHVVWQGTESGNWDIYYANSSSNWSILQVTNETHRQDLPKLTVTDNGVVHAFWEDYRDSDTHIYYTNSSSNWKNSKALSDGYWILPSVAHCGNLVYLLGDKYTNHYDLYISNSTTYYYPKGNFVSNVISIPLSNITQVTWGIDNPADTEYNISFVVSNESNFSSNITVGVSNGETIGDVARYVKYMVNYTSLDMLSTPILHYLSFKYLPVWTNVTYTVNYDPGLEWVALTNSTGTVVNASVSNCNTFYTNTVEVPTSDSYHVVYKGCDGKTKTYAVS